MSLEDGLNITVVGPDNVPSMPIPIHFKLDNRSDLDAYNPSSPDQPDLTFALQDGASSGGKVVSLPQPSSQFQRDSSSGYSTPITPYTGNYLDLSSVDTHLSPSADNYDALSAPHSPFSPSNLSPSFGDLSLSEAGSYPAQNDFNSNFKDLPFTDLGDFSTGISHQDQSAFNSERGSLSLVIPSQGVSDNSGLPDFMNTQDIFGSAFEDFLSPQQDHLPTYQLNDALPNQPSLQRTIPRNLHARNYSDVGTSWTTTPSSTASSTASTHLTSPSLSFTPSGYNTTTSASSSSLLGLPPSPYDDENYTLATNDPSLRRRHTSATHVRSSSRDERGRPDTRRSNQASASSSRRTSPYPSPRPSPDTLNPNHLWGGSDHLTVPHPGSSHSTLDMGEGGSSLPRRHSFSGAHSRSPSMGRLHASATHLSPHAPLFHNDMPSPSSSHSESVAALNAAAADAHLRKVASQAGIKASEARRTKDAKFACDWCEQTFTTNHNLKNHKNVHLGIKAHPCEKCQRPFTTQSVLARHLKTCKAVGP